MYTNSKLGMSNYTWSVKDSYSGTHYVGTIISIIIIILIPR